MSTLAELLNDYLETNGLSHLAFANVCFPKDSGAATRMAPNISSWKHGRWQPTHKYIAELQAVLGPWDDMPEDDQPSPVNRAVALAEAVPFVPPPRKPGQVFGFSVETDGQVRVTLDVRTDLGRGLRVMDALRGAGLLAVEEAAES